MPVNSDLIDELSRPPKRCSRRWCSRSSRPRRPSTGDALPPPSQRRRPGGLRRHDVGPGGVLQHAGAPPRNIAGSMLGLAGQRSQRRDAGRHRRGHQHDRRRLPPRWPRAARDPRDLDSRRSPCGSDFYTKYVSDVQRVLCPFTMDKAASSSSELIVTRGGPMSSFATWADWVEFRPSAGAGRRCGACPMLRGARGRASYRSRLIRIVTHRARSPA